MIKSFAVLLLFVCFLACLAQAMDIGTNFWNPGWHKTSDCFLDVRNVSGENPWNPQFLKEISIYSSLRFMDWNNANNSKRSDWSQRPHKDDKKQNPVAYEWMIDLCNRNGSDMWVCLPHLTVTPEMAEKPADYALRLAILVKTGVDMKDVKLEEHLDKLKTMSAEDFIRLGGEKTCPPLREDLKLYVEYSNETWNGMFRQAHYCWDTGEKMKLHEKNRWYAGFCYHAWAAIRIFRAADLVWGSDNDRIVKVLAGQASNALVSKLHVEVMKNPKLNPWNVRADAIASAPYFGHKVNGSSSDAASQLRKQIQRSAANSAKLKEIADEAGLDLIAYEGGQHVTTKAKAINRDPVMYDLYQEYLREMSKYYSHFCHYAHVGQAGDRGCWGCIEYTGQPVSEAPKYRALVEWSKKHNP